MSANSGEGIYNRVIVEGTGADGAPISVGRSSSQLAGVTASPVTSPAPDNPSFATNTSSWTASSGSSITRDTGVFDTSPASGRWDRSGGDLVAWDTLTETFTGTFLAGVTYTLTFKGDRSGPVSSFEYTFGTATDFARNANPFDPIGAFRVFQVSWTPSVTVSSGVTLRLRPYVGHPAYLWIDSLALAVAQPTLVDRRGFRRTHTLPVKSSLTEALAAQIGDTWLREHRTTPLKGTVKVSGTGAVRHILTGQNIAPEELLSMTGDMIRLSHRIDPDTGGQGRDGRIVEVRYDPRSDEATITLDSTRTNVEGLLERLAIVVGS